MVSFFSFRTVYENYNLISISDSRKSMSNDYNRDFCALPIVIYGILNNFLIHFIQSGGSLIKKEDLGFLQESSGDGDSLLLASRQGSSRSPYDCIKSRFNLLNESPSVGGNERIFDLGVSSIWFGEFHVFSDRCVEKHWFLTNIAYVLSKVSEVKIFNFSTVYMNCTTLSVIESFYKLNDG